jgi:UDP-2,3-diacylglucosamine pyrophosphatase LpxH
MGQWTSGNIIIIGDIFDHGLMDRLAQLCRAVANHLDDFSEDGERLRASNTAG